MTDEDETAGDDADTADMSGEPDVAKLQLISVPRGASVRASELESGAQLVTVDFPRHPSSGSATATDRVLFKVRVRRDEHDQSQGYFRDYKDGTGRPSDAHAALVAASAHEEAVKAVRVTWRHKLDVALAAAYVETNEKRLPEKLTEVAAIVTAWQEAIELRGSKARILAEQGAVKHVQRTDGSWKKIHLMPWWRRALKWLRLID
jgi:hypothetical protein